jgi:hypothetical protein
MDDDDTSFGSMPHFTHRRPNPTLWELISELGERRNPRNTAKIAENWRQILGEFFDEASYTVKIRPTEVFEILADTQALIARVAVKERPEAVVFYLLGASSRVERPREWRQQTDLEVEDGLHTRGRTLRVLRAFIKRDRPPGLENHFVWCATAIGAKVRFWRYTVYGDDKDDELDPFGEPALSAELKSKAWWQGTAKPVEEAEGEWVREMQGAEANLVFEEWDRRSVKPPGPTHLRYSFWQLAPSMHETERLHRPRLLCSRYRVFRPAMAGVRTLGTNKAEDERFVAHWLSLIESQGLRLAAGMHVTTFEAEHVMPSFFVLHEEDVGLESPPPPDRGRVHGRMSLLDLDPPQPEAGVAGLGDEAAQEEEEESLGDAAAQEEEEEGLGDEAAQEEEEEEESHDQESRATSVLLPSPVRL